MGYEYFKMLYIDWLVSEGLLFCNYFCMISFCLLSCVLIFSGLYVYFYGVLNNFIEYLEDFISFLMRLCESGYQIVYVGKWYMGEDNDDLCLGFDYFVIYKGQGKYFDMEFNFNGEECRVVFGYYMSVVMEMVKDWIVD